MKIATHNPKRDLEEILSLQLFEGTNLANTLILYFLPGTVTQYISVIYGMQLMVLCFGSSSKLLYDPVVFPVPTEAIINCMILVFW